MKPLFDNQADLLVKIRKLRLVGFALELENQFNNNIIYDSMPIEERLALCVDAQENYAKNKRCEGLIKKAKFKDNLKMTDLTKTREYGISDQVLATLTSLRWINTKTNIIVYGACGVGKTALINAIGYNCCNNGHSVRYFRALDFFDLLVEMPIPARQKFKENLKKTNVLILDDFALKPMEEEHRLELFSVIDDRQRLGSTIISTQLNRNGLEYSMGQDTKGEAICDRLFNPCIEVELKGPSRRQEMSNVI